MKKMGTTLVALAAAAALLSGCQSSEAKSANHSSINPKVLSAEKTPYVGDNSAVSGIVNKLPGAEHVKKLELETKEKPYGLTVVYGVKDGQDAAPFENSWNPKTSDHLLLNNAAALLILIKNADWAELKIETEQPQTIRVTRAELENLFGSNLASYAANAEKWEKDVVERVKEGDSGIQKFLEGHTRQ